MTTATFAHALLSAALLVSAPGCAGQFVEFDEESTTSEEDLTGGARASVAPACAPPRSFSAGSNYVGNPGFEWNGPTVQTLVDGDRLTGWDQGVTASPGAKAMIVPVGATMAMRLVGSSSAPSSVRVSQQFRFVPDHAYEIFYCQQAVAGTKLGPLVPAHALLVGEQGRLTVQLNDTYTGPAVSGWRAAEPGRTTQTFIPGETLLSLSMEAEFPRGGMSTPAFDNLTIADLCGNGVCDVAKRFDGVEVEENCPSDCAQEEYDAAFAEYIRELYGL